MNKLLLGIILSLNMLAGGLFGDGVTASDRTDQKYAELEKELNPYMTDVIKQIRDGEVYLRGGDTEQAVRLILDFYEVGGEPIKMSLYHQSNVLQHENIRWQKNEFDNATVRKMLRSGKWKHWEEAARKGLATKSAAMQEDYDPDTYGLLDNDHSWVFGYRIQFPTGDNILDIFGETFAMLDMSLYDTLQFIRNWLIKDMRNLIEGHANSSETTASFAPDVIAPLTEGRLTTLDAAMGQLPALAYLLGENIGDINFAYEGIPLGIGYCDYYGWMFLYVLTVDRDKVNSMGKAIGEL